MGLFDLFSNDKAEQAAREANAGVEKGLADLRTSYGQGRDALTTNFGDAKNLWSGLSSTYKGGADAYGDASGANGIEGLSRATTNFKNSGQYGVYGIGLNEGLNALDRTHAAAGNPLSGNADTDATRFASDQAMKAWGAYQTGLSPYLQNYGTSVAGEAGVDTGLGTALDSSFRGEGGAANTADTAVGANTGAATLNNYKIGANQLNALFGVGQLAMGMPPTALGNIGGGSGTPNFSGGSNSTPYGQTSGQPFDWSKTPIGQGYAGVKNLFSSFGSGGWDTTPSAAPDPATVY